MELRIGPQDETTERDLMIKTGSELATESADINYFDHETGEPVSKKSVANILLGGGSAAAYASGANNGVRTRLSEGKEFDYDVILHEMLHQLIKRPGEKEHELGGGLATPAESINAANVD